MRAMLVLAKDAKIATLVKLFLTKRLAANYFFWLHFYLLIVYVSIVAIYILIICFDNNNKELVAMSNVQKRARCCTRQRRPLGE